VLHQPSLLTRKGPSGLFGSEEESTAEFKLKETSPRSVEGLDVNLGQIFAYPTPSNKEREIELMDFTEEIDDLN
jgi:hypothetical protein